MRREQVSTREYLECDGCEYLLGYVGEDDKRPVVTTLSIPWGPSGGKIIEFHFHAPLAPADDNERHDCFRYWAHSPRIMRRSLEHRELSAERIETFMAIHLYRGHKMQPGIDRETVESWRD